MIHSMTAYASASDHGKWGTISWELRSVNHRYLDLSFRMPDKFRALEPELRKLAAKYLKRGKIDCTLKYQSGTGTELKFTLNHSLLKQLTTTAKELNHYFDKSLPLPNPLQLLAWENILQISEQSTEVITKKLVTLFEKALTKLVATRKKEGAALKQIISRKLQSISAEQAKVTKLVPQLTKNYRKQLLTKLTEVSAKINNDRLEQELVYFAQKIDIAEELDRLHTHVTEINKILTKGGTIGKRLDFFMQELNREANTLASKSSDNRVTHSAVELKVLIEQMREQIQNIE